MPKERLYTAPLLYHFQIIKLAFFNARLWISKNNLKNKKALLNI